MSHIKRCTYRKRVPVSQQGEKGLNEAKKPHKKDASLSWERAPSFLCVTWESPVEIPERGPFSREAGIFCVWCVAVCCMSVCGSVCAHIVKERGGLGFLKRTGRGFSREHCRSLSTKEPYYWWLFCGKRPTKIRHPTREMALSRSFAIYVHTHTATPFQVTHCNTPQHTDAVSPKRPASVCCGVLQCVACQCVVVCVCPYRTRARGCHLCLKKARAPSVSKNRLECQCVCVRKSALSVRKRALSIRQRAFYSPSASAKEPHLPRKRSLFIRKKNLYESVCVRKRGQSIRKRALFVRKRALYSPSAFVCVPPPTPPATHKHTPHTNTNTHTFH